MVHQHGHDSSDPRDPRERGIYEAVEQLQSRLLEQNRAQAMAMCIREARKTIPDALAEVREAVDFARCYAQRARIDFTAPIRLPGPTGEDNTIALASRGVFACISPWNFPLAIFSGQVLAARALPSAPR